ncbi:hypothetical protein ABZX85_43840 [Streptomyces sp. NPDC004539]|uniref:hypothetical protein n=1 Tax=Streptomyces sp. NPDC004539 TaxID=3154280 RepID=UPI0033A4257B
MNASFARVCTAAALTAFLAVGAGPAFAADTVTSVGTDQSGKAIPQAPADADAADTTVHPDGCPPDPTFSFSNVKSTFVGDKSKTVYGQSGVTLSVSVAKGHTWTGTISYAAKLSESILVASAEETISGSISYAKTTTVTLGGTWKVPANQKDGWLALGSKGYSFKWQRGSYNGACKWIVSNHGTAKLPALSPYIAHS